jgi:hypothetical protein
MDNLLGYHSPYERLFLQKEMMEMNSFENSNLTPYEFWKAIVDYEDGVSEDNEFEDDEIDEEDIVETSYDYWKRYLVGEAVSGVLSKQNGITGEGSGKDFKPREWTKSETQRYGKVSTVNTNKPKPPIPSNASPANATTSQQIAGGMKIWNQQRKSGDSAGASKTGMDVWRLANPKLAAAADEKARIRGTAQTDSPLISDMGLRSRMSPNTPSLQKSTFSSDVGPGSGNQRLKDNKFAFRAEPPKPSPTSAATASTSRPATPASSNPPTPSTATAPQQPRR